MLKPPHPLPTHTTHFAPPQHRNGHYSHRGPPEPTYLNVSFCRLCLCPRLYLCVCAHFRLQRVGALLLSAERLLQHVNVLLAVGVLVGQRLQLGLQGLHLRLLLV